MVIDQLDAVSTTSGRNPWFFDCLDELIHQAETQTGMRILIACRDYDFENDPRLRSLASNEVEVERIRVGPLSRPVIRQTIKTIGIDPDQLSNHQYRLLSVPAHLKLLCAIAEHRQVIPRFDTANDLYDRYWEEKDRLIRKRTERQLNWTQAVDTLCQYLSDRQSLHAPWSLLDSESESRDALLSESVLSQDGKSIAFFHEGFFDYAFARRFVERGGDVVRLLRSSEQHLFRRAQVRQILLHLRDVDQRQYLDQLEALLTSPHIRFHIKHVVFSLLNSYSEPTKEEWQILSRSLADSTFPYKEQIWSVCGKLPWFRSLDSLGVIDHWLRHPDAETVDRAVMILSRIQREIPDRVAELVEPFVGVSDQWRVRHRHIIQWADIDASRCFFDLFLILLNNGDLDGVGLVRENDFFGLLHSMVDRQPAWTCEAIGAFLQRRLNETTKIGGTNPLSEENGLRYSSSSEEVLIVSAQKAPRAFAEHILPVMLRVIELNVNGPHKECVTDSVWRYRYAGERHSTDSHLLKAAEESLRILASDEPEHFSKLVTMLRPLKYDTVQFLLMRAYSANEKRFADDAIEFLCESESRLSCGYANAPHCVARELIETATKTCSDALIKKLELILLEYYRSTLSHRGEVQFELLSAIEMGRRSERVRQRIGEWQRKFNSEEPRLHDGYSCSEISACRSPIPEHSAAKMSDDNWLRAVARHSMDRETVYREGRPYGGAIELARVMEKLAKKEPQRYARLALLLPDNTNTTYFDAILHAIDASVVDFGTVVDVCRYCHHIAGRPVGRSLCALVQNHPNLAWPGDILDSVTWYAIEDPDPQREWWMTEANGGESYYGGDIYTAGINCTRGVAASAISALLFADESRIPFFLPSLNLMVSDPSIAVRSCVVASLLPLLKYDRDVAIELFLKLCSAGDLLLQTRYVENFITHATYTHFDDIRPLIGRMIGSENPDVVQIGARCSARASLITSCASDLMSVCVSGTESYRLGVAEILAAHIENDEFQHICEPALSRLFDDPCEKVREAASRCFNCFRSDGLGKASVLVERFLESEAFREHHGSLLEALHETTAPLPEVAVDVCDRFIKIVGGEAGNIQTRAAGDARHASTIIIRAYHQASDDVLRRRCLDTIDNLLQLGAWGMDKAMDEYKR